MANYAAECGMKCAEADFQAFLAEATKLPVDDKEQAGEAVRVLARVLSRREFNESGEGATKWARVKRLYGLWRQGVGTNASGRRHGPMAMGNVAFSRGMPISANPFPPPDIGDEEQGDFDLWEAGWRLAQKRAREYERKVNCGQI